MKTFNLLSSFVKTLVSFVSTCAVILLVLLGNAQAADITIPVNQFTSYKLLNPEHAAKIQNMAWSPKNLTGRGAHIENGDWRIDTSSNGLPIGWFEYSFTIPQAGWYLFEYEYDWRVHNQSNGLGYTYNWIFDASTPQEYRLDNTGYHIKSGSSNDPIGLKRQGFVYLTAGAHTLRSGRWVKWGHQPLTSILFTLVTDSDLNKRVSVITNPYAKSDPEDPGNGPYIPVEHRHYMRPGDSFDIKIVSGVTESNSTRCVFIQVEDKNNPGIIIDEYEVGTTSSASSQIIPISVSQEGQYKLKYAIDVCGSAPGTRPEIAGGYNLTKVEFDVIDTTPLNNTAAVDNALIRNQIGSGIDCASTLPDYIGGQNDSQFDAQQRVVSQSPAGAYRETGDTGFYERHATEENRTWLQTSPNWFSYILPSLQKGKHYEIEMDYPDDTNRSMVVKIAEEDPLYFIPATGVDAGHEFPNTNTQQTVRLLYWPRTTNQPRLVIQNLHSNWRSACSKIRVYEVTDVPAMQMSQNGRDFAYWFEEPDRWSSPFGSDKNGNFASTDGLKESAERWMQTLQHLGVNTIFLQTNVYALTLWPSRSHFLDSEGGLFQDDIVRMILMMAEKYGVKVVAAFHPRADELLWARAMAGQADPFAHLAVNKDGQFYRSITYNNIVYPGSVFPTNAPKFTPSHPENRQWVKDAIVEFINRYKNETALVGVSLRTMDWTNPGFNNWYSLQWGYDDYTAAVFAADTGVSDPGTPQSRYTAFTSLQNKQTWIDWRISMVNAFNNELTASVQAVSPNLGVYSQVFLEDRLFPLEEAGLRDNHGVNGFEYIYNNRYGRSLHTNDETVFKSQITLRRTWLTDPLKLGELGESRAIGLTAHYLEDGAKTIPSSDLGLNYSALYTSAHIPPSGRYNLERYALALAYTDAKLLVNGGNSYFIDQDNIREFMAEYRKIPKDSFITINSITDEVVARELSQSGNYYFYFVNRSNVSKEIDITFSSDASLESLSTGIIQSTQARRALLTLEPFQLKAFKANAATSIHHVTPVGGPDTDGDSLSDQYEQCFDRDCQNYNPYNLITNPTGTDLDSEKLDTDSDGVADNLEIITATNPLDPADHPVFGDLNNDGLVNISDVLIGNRIILGNLPLPTGATFVRGDVAPLVNGVIAPDGIFSLGDVLLIMRKSLGLVSF